MSALGASASGPGAHSLPLHVSPSHPPNRGALLRTSGPHPVAARSRRFAVLWSEGTGASLPEDPFEAVPGKVEISLVRVARPALCTPRQGRLHSVSPVDRRRRWLLSEGVTGG